LMGGTLRKLSFSLIPVALLLGLGEVASRAVGGPECAPVTPSASGWDTMVADQTLLWKLEPDRLFESPAGNTKTNALGLRSVHLPPNKRGVRVAVTGDSSVFGWGQPDGFTYAEQLEEMLGRAFSVQVQVINMGVPGYSTEQTLGLMEQVGWSYEPDLLVVHNLFSDCNIDAFQDRAAMALTNPQPSVLENSRLYCAVRQPWVAYQAGLNQESNRVLMPGMPTGANQARRLEELDQLIDLSRVPLSDYLENLESLQDQADGRGASLLMAPLAQEWDVGLWTAPMETPTVDQVLPWHPYRTAQAEWVAQHDLLQVDLPSAFLASGFRGQELFIDHMHPSVLGAWVMATAVAESIVANPRLVGLGPEHVRENWRTPRPVVHDRSRGPSPRSPRGPAGSTPRGPEGPPNPTPPGKR
ncbi:MAG: lysophospholipase L1-like esterase, partial [Cognaticolwellia sp.]